MKKICTDCKGNGFIRIPYAQVKEEMWADCETCNSQGEKKIKQLEEDCEKLFEENQDMRRKKGTVL
jgi:DnaJ-class molecular chaperone